MLSTRTQKNIKRYKKHKQTISDTSCIFCLSKKGDESYVSSTKSFKILRNIFPYSTWDLQNVTDHLMIIPKKHTDTLNNLTTHEAIEYVNLLGSYESRGYNVYARSPGSGMKTVVHQHTHLIKTEGTVKRLLIYSKNSNRAIIV